MTWKRYPLTENPDSYGPPETPQSRNPTPPPYPYSYPPGPGGPYPGQYQSGPGQYQPGPSQPGQYQPGPYPGAYPPAPSPYGEYPSVPAAPRNGLGIAALVTAIVALIATVTIFGGIGLGLVAVILGIVAYGRVRRGDADNGGVAIAGIVLGIVAIVVSVALVFFGVWVFKSIGGGDYVECVQQAGQDQAKVDQCTEEFRQSVENRFSNQTRPSYR